VEIRPDLHESEKALTCEVDAYTLPNTLPQEGMDVIHIRNFLAVLAEIALSIASRNSKTGGIAYEQGKEGG
jgi:hypothetical protein